MKISKRTEQLDSPTLKGTVLTLEGRTFVRHVIRGGFNKASHDLNVRMGINTAGLLKALSIVNEAVEQGYLTRKAGRIVLTQRGKEIDFNN